MVNSGGRVLYLQTAFNIIFCLSTVLGWVFSNLDTQLGPLTDLKGRLVGADAVQSAVNEVIINAVEVKCHNQ